MNPGRPADYDSTTILALGGDAARAAALLIEPVAGRYRLVGWEEMDLVQRQASEAHLPLALASVCRALGERLGRNLWDAAQEMPRRQEGDPKLGLALGQVVALVDPRPPLRVWLAGLTPGESLAAAQRALEHAFCQVCAIHCFHGQSHIDGLAGELAELQPDVAVIVGGYDRPRPSSLEPVLELCESVAQAVQRLLPQERPFLCYAGSRWAAAEALELWNAVLNNLHAEAVANVAPAPGEEHPTGLAVALSHHYWHLSRALPGARELARWITRPAELRSMNWGFAQAVRVWREMHGLPHLHGLHCGPLRWLHVWAAADVNGVRVRFVPPGTRPADWAEWPPPRLISGAATPGTWASPPGSWWDPLGFVPLAAAVGQVAPEAGVQMLSHDLLANLEPALRRPRSP